MTVYAVFLNDANAEAWKRLQEHWPDGRHYILTNHLAFIAPEGITTTGQISDIIGMNKEREVLGIVFEWAAHNGFNRGDFWEWLRKVQS